MSLRRALVVVSGVLVAGSLLVSCGGGGDRVDTSSTDATTAAPTGSTAPSDGRATTTSPVTVRPETAGVDLAVYFVEGGKVAVGHRRVPPTQAVARAALEQLVAGPDDTETGAGFTSAVRPETVITGLTIADGVATVTLSPDIAGAYAATLAQAQVVYTLTQFKNVEKVRFGRDGTPLGREDFRDVTPLVLLESVAPGDTITSPVTVAGESNTFEATVRIRILGADGTVLADRFTTATSGTGTWGTFSERVAFDRAGNTTGKVVVFWDSPKDGSPQDVTEVPVRFG